MGDSFSLHERWTVKLSLVLLLLQAPLSAADVGSIAQESLNHVLAMAGEPSRPVLVDSERTSAAFGGLLRSPDQTTSSLAALAVPGRVIEFDRYDQVVVCRPGREGDRGPSCRIRDDALVFWIGRAVRRTDGPGLDVLVQVRWVDSGGNLRGYDMPTYLDRSGAAGAWHVVGTGVTTVS